MALQDNVKPGHCCLCGKKNFGCLCPRCWHQWRNEDGTIPAWLQEIRADMRRKTKAWQRNQGRIRRGNSTPRRGVGQPQKLGLRLISLDALLDSRISVLL